MKLLFDENSSFKLCAPLVDLFPNSSQVHLAALAKASDDEIWLFAKANGFVIVSLDADFADMATLYGAPPKVIWLRCGNQRSETIEKLLCQNAEAIRAFEQDDSTCLEVF